MCAHIGQNQHIYPPSINRLHFWLEAPSPLFRRLALGAAIEKNFLFFFRLSFYARLITIWVYFISLRITASIWFLDFIFPILNSYSYFIFLFFSYSRLDSCFDSVFRLSYLIISTRLKFVILYSILFFGISIVSTRYKFCSIFTRLWFSYSLLNLYSHQFRLVSALFILCFNSSTLYLFNSSACYKQTSMLMQSLFYACFGYFKAFWRVFACFRYSLSSWDKIMRQKA